MQRVAIIARMAVGRLSDAVAPLNVNLRSPIDVCTLTRWMGYIKDDLRHFRPEYAVSIDMQERLHAYTITTALKTIVRRIVSCVGWERRGTGVQVVMIRIYY